MVHEHCSSSSSSCNHEHHHSHDHHHAHSHDHGSDHWFKAGLGLSFGIVVLALSLAGAVFTTPGLFLITGINAALALYLGSGIYQSAFKALSQGRWNHATLYTMSSLILVTVSVVGLFMPGLFISGETAAMMLGFWHLGEAIEHSLVDKLEEKLDIRDCLPKEVMRQGKHVAVEDLLPGDIIEIQPGEVIPVDGRLQQKAFLHTTRVNGRSKLKGFEMDETIKSGMQLPKHAEPIKLTVVKPYADSHLSLEAKAIQKAHKEKAPLEVLTAQILKYFIPSILTIALISAVVISIFYSPLLAIQCATSVLVSACPCVLSLITPMTVKLAMKKGHDIGVRFKDSKAIQNAAEVDDVIFDCNGTLTEGLSTVTNIQLEEADKIAHLALLEHQSEHGIGQAIYSHIRKHHRLSFDELKLEALDKSHHSGIKAKINGDWFIIGNKDMLASEGIQTFSPPFDKPDQGHIYFVRNQTIIGQIQVEDKIRSDSIPMLRALEKQGKVIHMATGDHIDAAKACATKLGIPHAHIYANSSEDKRSKIEYIKALQAQGRKVAMIGDSANDASAIAYADLGIAVKSPTAHDITEREADIVLHKGEVFPIAQLFEIATTAKQTMLTNLTISLGYNAAITLLAAGLFVSVGLVLSPVVGVALMILESTIVMGLLFMFKASELKTTLPEASEKATDKVDDTYGFFSQKLVQEDSTIEVTEGCAL